jgi:hypothetical protein
MSLPVHQNALHAGTGLPGSPADRLHGAHNTDVVKRRADDQRRLRRVKDSREQLKSRSRTRAASSGTIDTTTSGSTTAGRSYTVANVHHGVIYLRYARRCFLGVLLDDVNPHKTRGKERPLQLLEWDAYDHTSWRHSPPIGIAYCPPLLT